MTPEHKAEQWLKDRQRIIAATDVPRVLGVYFDREKGPENVYREKLGIADPVHESAMMTLGKLAQPTILARYAAETGLPIMASDGLTYDPDDRWIAASLDATILNASMQAEPVDAKLIFYDSDEWGIGGDQVPEKILLQLCWQILVTRAEFGHVAAWFVTKDKFRIYTIQRDSELIAMLVEIMAAFQLRVIQRRGVDDWQHSLIPKVLQRCQRVTPGKSVALPVEMKKVAADYVELGKSIKEAEERRDEAKGIILDAMGDAEQGILPDGSICRRKLVDRKGYTVGPSSYVDFRILKGRKAKAAPKPYALPDMSAAESAEAWLQLEGESIEKAIANIKPEGGA